jgi:hypothetical protein
MDTKERRFVINKADTLPGVAVARTVTLPEISIADLERALADEEAFEEYDTEEIEVPACDDDDEGPTGVYQIGSYLRAVEVHAVQRA